MIKGIGTDIIKIARIEKAVANNRRFLEKVFTEKEREMFESRNFRSETIAGNFAAKEAIAKAFGTGIRNFNFVDIEILRDELGKPVVSLYNNALVFKNEKEISTVDISISHCEDYAVAFAVMS